MLLKTSYEVDMILTRRDLELFRKLSNYGMLSTKQTQTIVFSGIALTTVLRRLRVLEDRHCLRRIIGLKSQELLWVLTPKGAEVAKVSIPKRHWSKNMLEHDYKLLSLRLKLEGSGIARSWIPEHEIRSKIFKKYGIRGAKDRIIPDGLMSIEVNGKMESVAIELELTLKNKQRIKQTIRRYQGHHDLYGIWYVAPKKFILDSAYSEWLDANYMHSNTKFFASLLDDVMENKLEAKLMGIKPHRKNSELWQTIPAQRVSTQDDRIIEIKTELTEENHAPILDIAS